MLRGRGIIDTSTHLGKEKMVLPEFLRLRGREVTCVKFSISYSRSWRGYNTRKGGNVIGKSHLIREEKRRIAHLDLKREGTFTTLNHLGSMTTSGGH